MSWNYRVMRRSKQKVGGTCIYEIVEAYYNSVGKVHSWSARGIAPCGGTFADLKKDFKMMKRAFAKSILDEKDIMPKNPKPKPKPRSY